MNHPHFQAEPARTHQRYEKLVALARVAVHIHQERRKLVFAPMTAVVVENNTAVYDVVDLDCSEAQACKVCTKELQRKRKEKEGTKAVAGAQAGRRKSLLVGSSQIVVIGVRLQI